MDTEPRRSGSVLPGVCCTSNAKSSLVHCFDVHSSRFEHAGFEMKGPDEYRGLPVALGEAERAGLRAPGRVGD